MIFQVKFTVRVFFLLLLAFSSFAKNFSAHVDKTTLSNGDSLSLTLEYDEQTNDKPDFTPIEKEFTIVSKQTAQESNFINGNHRAKTSWILELLPKSSAKNLTIPSIKLGQLSSSPIAIVQADQSASTRKEGILVTMTADRREVYINGELVVTIIIKTPLALRNASLSKLEIKDAIVEPLIEGERNEEVENGIKYSLFKQTYAVYPNKAGALAIPPVVFRGIAAPSRHGGQGIRGLFSNGSSVSTRSNEVLVTVKDVPPSFPKGHQFVPLKSFVIIESFDESNPVFEVNKATSRRFEVKAKGALSSYLPKIATPSIKDLQIYAESGTRVQKNEADGMLASAKFSHIYMPLAPGHLVVPEQVIYWWDVDEDKLKKATIRALDLDVKGDAIVPSAKPPIALEQPVVEKSPATKTAPIPTTSVDYRWPILALVFLLLWLSTLALFLWQRRLKGAKTASAEDLSSEQAFIDRVKATSSACDSNDAKNVYRTLKNLLSWIERHDTEVIGTQELLALHQELERSLYDREGHTSTEVIVQIKRCVKELRLARSAKLLIAPLYPS